MVTCVFAVPSLKVVHVCVLGRFLFEVLTCAVSLCVSGAVRGDFDVCDVAACVFAAQSSDNLCACGVFAPAAFSCIGRGPRFSRALCMCACSRCSHLRVARVRFLFFLRALD